MPPPTFGGQRHYVFGLSVPLNLINGITPEYMKGIYRNLVDIWTMI